MTADADKSQEKRKKAFGGIYIILVGDPGQLLPVGERALFTKKELSGTALDGMAIYYLFKDVIKLDVNNRQSGHNKDQQQFRELLLRLRNGETTRDD